MSSYEKAGMGIYCRLWFSRKQGTIIFTYQVILSAKGVNMSLLERKSPWPSLG